MFFLLSPTPLRRIFLHSILALLVRLFNGGDLNSQTGWVKYWLSLLSAIRFWASHSISLHVSLCEIETTRGTYLPIESLWIVNVLIHAVFLKQCLVHSKISIHVSYYCLILFPSLFPSLHVSLFSPYVFRFKKNITICPRLMKLKSK